MGCRLSYIFNSYIKQGYLLVVCFVLSIAFENVYANSLSPDQLDIVFNSRRSFKYDRPENYNFKQEWNSACASFGRYLKVRKGLFASGVFSSIRCKVDTEIKNEGEKISDWQLEVSDTKEKVILEIKYKGILQSEFSFLGSSNTLKILKEKYFSEVIAYALLTKMPMMMVINPKKIKNRKSILGRSLVFSEENTLSEEIEPQEHLLLYYLNFDEKSNQWLPEVIGSAKLNKYTLSKSKKKYKVAYWDLEFFKGYVERDKTVWAHSLKGRSNLYSLDEIQSFTNTLSLSMYEKYKDKSLLGSLTKFIKDSYASGYVGLRYGKQILFGDPLMEEVSFLGVLTEIRGGVLDGLKVYYDTTPEVKAITEGNDVSLFWDRWTFGTGFSVDPGLIINRLEIIPKVGLWTFDGTLPVLLSTGAYTSKKFVLNNSFSLGLEGRMEILSPWYTLSAWAGYQKSMPVGENDSVTVTSLRYGLDTYFSVGSQFNIFDTDLNMNLMAFLLFETVDLNSSAETDVTERFNITDIKYNAIYVGTGVAVSW